MLEYDEIDISEELMSTKQMPQNNVTFANIVISKTLILNMNHISAMVVID